VGGERGKITGGEKKKVRMCVEGLKGDPKATASGKILWELGKEKKA